MSVTNQARAHQCKVLAKAILCALGEWHPAHVPVCILLHSVDGASFQPSIWPPLPCVWSPHLCTVVHGPDWQGQHCAFWQCLAQDRDILSQPARTTCIQKSR